MDHDKSRGISFEIEKGFAIGTCMNFGHIEFEAEQRIDWIVPKPPLGCTPTAIYIGRDDSGIGAIQVAIAYVTAPPTRETMRSLHSARKGKSTVQIVVGAVLGDLIWLFGPDERAEVVEAFPLKLGHRQLQSALNEPNAISAYARIGQFRRAMDSTSLSGFINNGLFASHHIRENVPKRTDWIQQSERAREWLHLRDENLIRAMGYKVEKTAGAALILRSDTPIPQAVAVLLDETEQFDSASQKHGLLSPAAWGLNVAVRQGVPWLIVLRKDQIRLYPARDGIGVGQKSQVETYFEVDLAAIDESKAGLIALIFSADALGDSGTVGELLEGSHKYALQLGSRLRERIYEHVVPNLARNVATRLKGLGHVLDGDGLALSYGLTLRILFRLLFQAYAEDRGLLPSGRNESFDANSLKSIASRHLDTPIGDFGEAQSLWLDLIQVWNAIDAGNKTWDVPAYNGGLFGTDPELHPEGSLIEQLSLPDSVMGPVLQNLLIDDTEDGVRGPVDFRSLSVREFGTIYEGLLESSLSVAYLNLTIDEDGTWVPAARGDEVHASSGEVYFHSSSGERKATGSYFTPSFVVEHIIARTLDPALDEHLARIQKHLDGNDQAAAARDFFDFRVADLAMGSGHFLVAAVDRIEARMRTFLGEKSTSIPGIDAELYRLGEAAKLALGKDETAFSEIEPAALLRRQIARRCIYGLDVNPLAVELSRLALWIHTFVPGLPMSSLDHGLVCANSLTGIGTINEAIQALSQDSSNTPLTQGHGVPVSFYESIISDNLEQAKLLLLEVANSDEAKKSEVREAAKGAKRAREAASSTRLIFDAAVGARLGFFDARAVFDERTLISFAQSEIVAESIKPLNPAHMPYLFPEVFLRDKPGFDVLLGNPPWEELVYEEIKYWTLRNPGLRGKSIANQLKEVKKLHAAHPDQLEEMQAEMEATNRYREVLMSGPYEGMGSGHADLYKAFSWRYLQLCRDGGYIGAVLPRGALTAAGSSEWRRAVIKSGKFVETVFLLNSNGWVFPSVHGQYSIAIVGIQKGVSGRTVLAGPFTSETEFTEFGSTNHEALLESSSILEWSETAAFPLLPSPASVKLFLSLRKARSLGSIKEPNFEFAPVQGDFNQTTDRKLIYLDDQKRGELLAYKGASFNLWNPATGELLGSASLKTMTNFLNKKIDNACRMKSSAFYGFKKSKDGNYPFGFSAARIAFRLITNQTNTRTIISCLVPPEVVLGNGAPFLVRRAGDEKSEAYLLGILSSIPLDWYARRFVELNVNFHILNGFPIPEFDGSTLCERLVFLAGSLAAVDKRYAKWAKRVGVTVNSVLDEQTREKFICEIDAVVAHLYQLDRDDICHLFETFHKGWDYAPKLASTLEHFDSWAVKL